MISIKKLRAVGVISALFGVGAAMISVTINLGSWLQPEFPRVVGVSVIFATAPAAFVIGSLIGAVFAGVVATNRVRTANPLHARWLVGAGVLGGATVGVVGSLVVNAPHDLQSAAHTLLPSVGLFALIGAGIAGLLGTIARRHDARTAETPRVGLAGDAALLNAEDWSAVRGIQDHERHASDRHHGNDR